MYTITFYDALEKKIFRNLNQWENLTDAQDEAAEMRKIPEFSRVKVVDLTPEVKRLPTFTDL
jgi:hypothetical protein